MICTFMHAEALCQDGTCVMGDCSTNWYDFNGDPSDGCETSCVKSAGGIEICDGVDNDCNGIIDDYWTDEASGGQGHFADDPNNCGACGRVCAFPNGEGSCVGGQCTLASCSDGYSDADGDSANGCECRITGTDDSVCDGVDNDCDGATDEDVQVEECYTGPGCTENPDGTFSCVGECQPGHSQCNGGTFSCVGQVGPQAEICDGKDNDCDGQTDEGFDLNTDPNNCGACGTVCSLANAYSTCSGGSCVVTVCKPGFINVDGDASNGCEYACAITNGGVEDCSDGVDNDCDGQIDEFDAASDPYNCGSCGYSCEANAPANMTVTGCVNGTCQYTCRSNYYDFDGNTSNGCETYCAVSNGGVEACDGVDNDCDGTTDEDYDTNTDVQNCGSCGYVCADHAPAHMHAVGCSNGTCQYECDSGYLDLDGLQVNGCEYQCSPTNGGVEQCDGADNDCDGQIDEDSQGNALTRHCYTGPSGTEGVGLCQGGTETCINGSWNGICAGQVTPQSESCDGQDEDCDGATDEDYDTNNDVLNCGGCGVSCFTQTPAHAVVSGCSSGSCEFACEAGYVDLDGDLNTANSNGCEYQCTYSGSEDCNGIDDDCDGLVDENDPDLPSPAASLYCDTDGPCSTVTLACSTWTYNDGSTEKTWVCNYPSVVERLNGDHPRYVAYRESLCDGNDNDCDGYSDEDFYPVVGSSCDDGDLGECLGTGSYRCKSDKSGTECVIKDPGANPSHEVCDGKDNDCDGLVDETPWNPGSNASYVRDEVDSITVGGHTVYVYTYEASKPNATSSSVGSGSEWRACSRDGVLPWNRVTYTQAQEACAKAGMRLCTSDEWYMACAGSSRRTYPYGNTYNSSTCNGDDNGAGGAVPSGSKNGCYNSTTGPYDTSGNLREWTMDYVGTLDDGTRVFVLRGGSYIDESPGLACDFDTSGYPENAFDSFIGFRCCTTCGNGTVDTWEQCDDGNRVDGDGCDHFCARENGQTCGNGVREGSEQCDDGNRVAGDGCSQACMNE